MSDAAPLAPQAETAAPRLARLPYSFARRHGLALSETDAGQKLHLSANGARHMISEIARNWPKITAIETLTPSAFETLLSELYAQRGFDSSAEADGTQQIDDDLNRAVQSIEQAADLLDSADDAPIIRLLNSLLSEAVRAGASDIHLEPFENKLVARLRIDGILTEIASLSAKLAPYLVSRVKVMARLDIAETRLPQDGRLSLTLGDKNYDVRVSSLPIRYGERVVMRLLDKDKMQFNLGDLGMDDVSQQMFQKALSEPNGIILVTGPTGSGKTTTLYAALGILNETTRNIITVEDPIEYALQGVSQTQVNSKIGMSFAIGLRSILRQDPDIVMVGEIRDRETAEIAVQASLTGHVVLSTVHTNSAAAAVTRLIDMGIEPYLLMSSLKLVLAQRLVRRLCSDCKTTDAQGEPVPVGCPSCQQNGYRGRIGIYELLAVDDTIRTLLANGASEQEMEAHGFTKARKLADNGFRLVEAGETTRAEIMRVARLPEDA